MKHKGRDSGAKKCLCSKCGTEARSISGTTHRRCPGAEGLPIKPKSQGIPMSQRGQWI